MKLPKLPKANAVIQTGLGQTVMFSANQYTEAQMLQFQRDTVEACAKALEGLRMYNDEDAADVLRELMK